MSDPDNFLARWARRKAEAAEESANPTATPPDATSSVDQEASAAHAPAEPGQTTAPPPAIDPATLPPIESIVAGTDIRQFLQAGVPAELTRAALRRVWATDPTIRDFIGLSENSWDFTAPGGVPGFGPLSAEDASRAMAQLTSRANEIAETAKDAVDRMNSFEPTDEADKAAQTQPKSALPGPNQTAADRKTENSPSVSSVHMPEAELGESNSLQRNEDNIATQKKFPGTGQDLHPTRRGHGGALPK